MCKSTTWLGVVRVGHVVSVKNNNLYGRVKYKVWQLSNLKWCYKHFITRVISLPRAIHLW